MNPVDIYRCVTMTICGIALFAWSIAEPGHQALVSGVSGFLMGSGIYGLAVRPRRSYR
jgi:hypothetical protein